MKAASQMLQYKIRNATVGDLSQVYEIEEASFTNPYPMSLISQLLDDYPESFLVAIDEGERIVGYCVSTRDGRSLHLVSIAVRPEYRREGIGSGLMRRLLEHTFSTGVEDIVLEVKLENTAALTLYRKFGFESRAVIDNYYSNREPALKMQLVSRRSSREPK